MSVNYEEPPAENRIDYEYNNDNKSFIQETVATEIKTKEMADVTPVTS